MYGVLDNSLNVRVVEGLEGLVIGIVKRGERGLYVIALAKKFGDLCGKSVGVELGYLGLFLFVSEFVPDSNSDFFP